MDITETPSMREKTMTTAHNRETETAMRVLSNAEIDAVVGGGMLGIALPLAAVAIVGNSGTAGSGDHGGSGGTAFGRTATGGNGGT